MFINYYFISGCNYKKYDGKPCIFAPDDTDSSLLDQYHFQQTEDDKYYKILTESEYEAIMQGYPYYDISFTYENSKPLYIFHGSEKILKETPDSDDNHKIPVQSPPDYTNYYNAHHYYEPDSEEKSTAFILSAAALGCFILSAGVLILTFNILLSGFFACAALILMIVARLHYPESIFGKIVSSIGVLLFIVCLFFMIYIIIACHQVIEEFSSCCGSGIG